MPQPASRSGVGENEHAASFTKRLCWRRISAVQKPRVAAAVLFTAPSYPCSHGFCSKWSGRCSAMPSVRRSSGAYVPGPLYREILAYHQYQPPMSNQPE